MEGSPKIKTQKKWYKQQCCEEKLYVAFQHFIAISKMVVNSDFNELQWQFFWCFKGHII